MPVLTTYAATEPFARGYVAHPWHGTLREEPRHDSAAMAPAGQLWSTATDLARWAAVLASSTTGLSLELPFVAEMATPVVISDPESWTAGYGLGLQLFRRGVNAGQPPDTAGPRAELPFPVNGIPQPGDLPNDGNP